MDALEEWKPRATQGVIGAAANIQSVDASDILQGVVCEAGATASVQSVDTIQMNEGAVC